MKRVILLFTLSLASLLAVHGEVVGVANYGFYAGVGGSFPLGELRNNFGNAVAFQIGLTGGYRNAVLKADVSFAQPSFRNDNIFSAPLDAEGRPSQGNSNSNATHLTVGIQAGYTVLRSGALAITPCAGVMYGHFGWDLNNYLWSKDSDGNNLRTTTSVQSARLSSWGWMASIDFDITVHRRFNDGSLIFGRRAERLSSSIRITPWIGHASYHSVPAVKGCQLGFTLAYRGLATLLE